MNENFINFLIELKATLRQEILDELRTEFREYMTSEQSKSIVQKEEDIIKVEEASKILKLATSTIYSKVSKNELPVLKRGKPLLFSKIALNEYLNSDHRKTFSEINYEAEKGIIKNRRKSNR
jgi:excisionase family DNA binding protein